MPRPDPDNRGGAVTTRSVRVAPNWLGTWISKTLDVIDVLADATGEALRLR